MKRVTGIIDVWDAQTFDDDLLAELHANAEIVRGYATTEREIFLENQPSIFRRSNPYAAAHQRFIENLARQMETRTIRAWHYTRLTDREVEALLTTGIKLSTLDMIRERLNAQVAAGSFSADVAAALFAASPFHHREQAGLRSNRFCLVSHPHQITDEGVTLLLGNWGGEGVYFWLDDTFLEETVARLGKPRIIEVAIPLDATRQSYFAAKSVVATFARTLGCVADFGAFDLSIERALPPHVILRLHTEGEPAFGRMGDGYPTNFRV